MGIEKLLVVGGLILMFIFAFAFVGLVMIDIEDAEKD